MALLQRLDKENIWSDTDAPNLPFVSSTEGPMVVHLEINE